MSNKRKSLRREGLLSLNLKEKREKRVGDMVGIGISEDTSRPLDTVICGGPNPEERASMWLGKPPIFDEVWHRRVYDMNKKLADDLCRGVCVKIGGVTTGPPFNDMDRKKKDWS